MSLTIEIIPEDPEQADRVRVLLNGRLDGTTSPRLEEALEPVLAGRVRALIMDFANLDFISSMGIRVVVMSQKALSSRDGSVILLNMKPQIQRVMEIINALPGLSVFRDTQAMDEHFSRISRKAVDDNA
jgi:anti-anti-sigma factor